MKHHLALIQHVILLAVLLLSGLSSTGPALAQQSVSAEVKVASINVRQGPSVAYPVIGSLASGVKADVTGVHPASGWLRIVFGSRESSTKDGAGAGQGWITGGADYVTVHGSLSDVAQVTDVPAANVTPAATPVATTTVAAKPTAAPVASTTAAAQPTLAAQTTPAPATGAPGTLGKLVFETSTGGDIYVINADGTGLRRLTNGFDPALSPDGTKVVFGRWDSFPRGVWVINADGTDEHLVFGYDATTIGVRAPAWSPDGQMIAFQLYPGDDTQKVVCFKYPVPGVGLVRKCISGPRHPWWKIATITADGQDFRTLLSHDFAYSPSWAPDSVRLIYASDQGLSLTSTDNSVGDVHDAANKWRMTDYQGDRSPVWAPNLHRIVFQTKSAEHWEIVVLNDDAKGRNQVTRSWPLADVAVNSVSPTWSPDGQYIAYFTDERGRWELYRMKADGSEKGPFLEDALKGITFQYNSVDERLVSWGR